LEVHLSADKEARLRDFATRTGREAAALVEEAVDRRDDWRRLRGWLRALPRQRQPGTCDVTIIGCGTSIAFWNAAVKAASFQKVSEPHEFLKSLGQLYKVTSRKIVFGRGIAFPSSFTVFDN